MHRFVSTLRKQLLRVTKCFNFLDDAVSRTQTCEWYSPFNCDQTSVEDFERLGRPSSRRTDENEKGASKASMRMA